MRRRSPAAVASCNRPCDAAQVRASPEAGGEGGGPGAPRTHGACKVDGMGATPASTRLRPGLACRRMRRAAAERLRCARRAPARRMPTPAACAARRGGSARSKLAVGTPPISRRRVGLKDLSAGHCHAGTKVIISLGRANGAARRYRQHVRACARAQHAPGQRPPERRAGALRWGAWACAAQAHRARVAKCKDVAAMKRPGRLAGRAPRARDLARATPRH